MPFTCISLPNSDALEFVIKSYQDHEGVIELVPTIEPGDELSKEDAWGAGTTPFITFFRDLSERVDIKCSKSLFVNKKERDIIKTISKIGWIMIPFLFYPKGKPMLMHILT